MRRHDPTPTVSAADEAHTWLRPLGPNPTHAPLRIKAARAATSVTVKAPKAAKAA